MASLGIDFGTSTTAALISSGAHAAFLHDAQDHEILPSMLAWSPNSRLYSGYGAKARVLIDPANSLHSFKRVLGKSWRSSAVQRFRQQYATMQMEATADDRPCFVTRVGKLTVVDVVAHFLVSLRELEPLRGASISNATLSVPATSERPEREALLEAATRAGIRGATLIEEPYAAAIAHFTRSPAANAEQLLLVYDLGGGTFDAALVACQGKKLRLLGISGDPYLGGDDIDSCVADWAARQILEIHHWDVRTSPTAFFALRLACERAKIRLSSVDRTTIELEQIDPALAGKELPISRAQFEPLFSGLVRRTFVACDELFARAGVRPDAVSALVLSGGSCHIPAIRAAVQHYVGRSNQATLPPDRLCAVGALAHALQGERLEYSFAPIDARMIS